MNKNIILLTSCLALVVGCQSTKLPVNVKTTNQGGNAYIKEISHTINVESVNTDSFNKIKFCVADIFQNENVVLEDSAGSFVGAYTGNYYQTNNSKVVNSEGTFKYVDDQSQKLIAKGTVKYNSDTLVPLTQFLKFNINVTLKESTAALVYKNITRAQQDTGSMSNSGFQDVGTWYGARAEEVVSQVKFANDLLSNCVNS